MGKGYTGWEGLRATSARLIRPMSCHVVPCHVNLGATCCANLTRWGKVAAQRNTATTAQGFERHCLSVRHWTAMTATANQGSKNHAHKQRWRAPTDKA